LTKFLPDAPTRVILGVHGLGEFGGRYHKWAENFVENQWAFYVHDQRGHGKTPGKQGIVSSYDLFLKDIDCVRRAAAAEHPGLPVFLHGHSMGGNIVLNYILKGFAGDTGADGSSLPPITGAVVISPWLKAFGQPPRFLIKPLRVLGGIFPNYTYKARISGLSRDARHLTDIDPESLLHSRLGLKIICQIIQAGEYALAHGDKINLPTLLMSGKADTVVSPAAIDALAHKAGTRIEYKSWDMYHELHNDIGREDVFLRVKQFIVHCPQAQPGS